MNRCVRHQGAGAGGKSQCLGRQTFSDLRATKLLHFLVTAGGKLSCDASPGKGAYLTKWKKRGVLSPVIGARGRGYWSKTLLKILVRGMEPTQGHTIVAEDRTGGTEAKIIRNHKHLQCFGLVHLRFVLGH